MVAHQTIAGAVWTQEDQQQVQTIVRLARHRWVGLSRFRQRGKLPNMYPNMVYSASRPAPSPTASVAGLKRGRAETLWWDTFPGSQAGDGGTTSTLRTVDRRRI